MSSQPVSKQCFVISPIGDEGSDIRQHADDVFEFVIAPAMAACGIEPKRSDEIDRAGKISDQMFQAIFDADLCVVVLTTHNPNVYYELALAHSFDRPTILLIEKGDKLPFDVQDLRTIEYDLGIRSFKQRTYIDKLISFVHDIEHNEWRGQGLFSAYHGSRRAGSPTQAALVEGLWWEFVLNHPVIGASAARIVCQGDQIQVGGHAFEPNGTEVAAWRSVFAAFRGQSTDLYYLWTGDEYRTADERFSGFGLFQFDAELESAIHQRGSGWYTAGNIVAGEVQGTIRVHMRRMRDTEVVTMRGDDDQAKARLVANKYAEWKATISLADDDGEGKGAR